MKQDIKAKLLNILDILMKAALILWIVALIANGKRTHLDDGAKIIQIPQFPQPEVRVEVVEINLNK